MILTRVTRFLVGLMYDIETVFLFPWAVVADQVGVYALVSVGFFLVVLILGLANAAYGPIFDMSGEGQIKGY